MGRNCFSHACDSNSLTMQHCPCAVLFLLVHSGCILLTVPTSIAIILTLTLF